MALVFTIGFDEIVRAAIEKGYVQPSDNMNAQYRGVYQAVQNAKKFKPEPGPKTLPPDPKPKPPREPHVPGRPPGVRASEPAEIPTPPERKTEPEDEDDKIGNGSDTTS